MTLSQQDRETESIKTKSLEGETARETDTERQEEPKVEAEAGRKRRGRRLGKKRSWSEEEVAAEERLGAWMPGPVQPPSSHRLGSRGLSTSPGPEFPGASASSVFPPHRCGKPEAQRGGGACPHPVQPPTPAQVIQACANCCVSSSQMLTLSGLPFHQRL